LNYFAPLSQSSVMPASLYQSNLNMERISTTNSDLEDNRAVKLAYELAMLGLDNSTGSPLGMDALSVNSLTRTLTLEELKTRKSQNMTECVPVPTSEHVAEIVGRQGCKIKALRAKTNTYIKTPARGEEPVFVVTGRKEDVGLAKREILSAAEHFSQIRASRKNNINSTLAFGQMVANTPGQTTIQVRVPYRVVGLVVGPKGATIKRIQQQTHTYIVTPSRDKEPVFEVTGLPENVEAARKEIESHIALRTGSGLFENMEGVEDNITANYSSAFSSSDSSGLSSLLSDTISSSSTNANLLSKYHTSNSILSVSQSGSSLGNIGSNINSMADDLHIHGLIDSNNFDSKFNNLKNRDVSSIGSTLWGCGDSHDSGIGHSPPYDSSHSLTGLSSNGAAIWSELGKVFGNLDSPPTEPSPPLITAPISKPSPSTPRSASIDLGIPLSNPAAAATSSGLGLTDSLVTAGSDSSHTSLPFTLSGLTTTLATLSASLSTLNENGAADSSDLLSSLRRNGSPDVDHPDKLHPAFVTDSKPLGIHRDFLSFTNH